MQPASALRFAAGARPRWRARGALALLIACALASPVAHAGSIGLDDAIRGALAGNLILRSDATKVDAASGQLQQAKGAFDWTGTAETGWERIYTPRSVDNFLTTSLGTVNAWRTTVGVHKEFSNGIQMTPGVTTYTTPGVTAGQTLGQTRTIPSLNLTIPLARGLGEEAADATERAARNALEGTRLDHEFAAAKLVHDVVQVFWRCLAAEADEKTLAAVDRENDAYGKYLQSLVATGQAEPTVAERASANRGVQHLELDRAVGNTLRCRRELALALGEGGKTAPLPIGTLPDPDQLAPAVSTLQPDRLYGFARDHRVDLRALKKFVEAKSDRLKGAQDEALPQLDVVLDPSRAYLRLSQSLHRDAAKGHAVEAAAAESDARIALMQREQQIESDLAELVPALKRVRDEWSAVRGSQHRLVSLVADTERRAKAGTVDRREVEDVRGELTHAEREATDIRLKFALLLADLRLLVGAIDVNVEGPSALAADFAQIPRP